MTYQETLDWMFAQLPMYQEKGENAFHAKLDGIKNFVGHLHHPETKFKSIHVGGTNGKGSSCHMLASILQEAGYKVGLYTSPHLKDFRERIRINGLPVGKAFVIDFIKENRAFFEEYQLSFFEMTVGMAFDYFASEKVDIAIVEVGLGGRLDSTNIIVPEVSLITNIGMDHVDMLGDTLEKIAFEKAGIIKPGTPVVISEYQEATAPVFQKLAASNGAELIYADKEVQETYKTVLSGNYQPKNVKGVLAVLNVLKNFEITKKHIRAGLTNVIENTGLLGRWQILRKSPMVVCDTAHNSEGIAIVIDQIKQQKFEKLHIVLGFVKDKNLDTILPLFPNTAEYYFCKPNILRGLGSIELMGKAKVYELYGVAYDSVLQAYGAAKENANVADFIFIGGSTFVVAEVL